MVEDISFLQELKSKQMHDAGFTEKQIRQFQKVDDQFLTNWKDNAIISIVKRAPPTLQIDVAVPRLEQCNAVLKQFPKGRIGKQW